MLKENPEVKHTWTEHEKQINCKICLLASTMKDCQACPFYIAPINNTVSKV